MPTTTQRITAEELLAMPHDQRCELIAGEIVPMTPPGDEHGNVTLNVGAILRQHVLKSDLGRVTVETGFIVARDPDTVRAPDVAFVRRERQPSGFKGYVPFAPDLAVEVASPTDRESELDDKAKAWLDAGTAVVWVVWPNTRSVVVHRKDQPPRILHEQDSITGEELLPGFQCAVAEFFSE